MLSVEAQIFSQLSNSLRIVSISQQYQVHKAVIKLPKFTPTEGSRNQNLEHFKIAMSEPHSQVWTSSSPRHVRSCPGIHDNKVALVYKEGHIESCSCGHRHRFCRTCTPPRILSLPWTDCAQLESMYVHTKISMCDGTDVINLIKVHHLVKGKE